MTTQASETQEALRTFLCAQAGNECFRLVLPEFQGVSKPNDRRESWNYHGSTFAERDTRAASHVQELLDQVARMGSITVQGTGSGIAERDITFLFGSRSNSVTGRFLQQSSSRLFRFEFNDIWTIICNAVRFSLPNPTLLSPELYAAADDFGVIARVRSPANVPVFMIAGLGGRATEGCGFYFREHWRELNSEFGFKDFAVIVRFAAPFHVGRAERVASATELPFAV